MERYANQFTGPDLGGDNETDPVDDTNSATTQVREKVLGGLIGTALGILGFWISSKLICRYVPRGFRNRWRVGEPLFPLCRYLRRLFRWLFGWLFRRNPTPAAGDPEQGRTGSADGFQVEQNAHELQDL